VLREFNPPHFAAAARSENAASESNATNTASAIASRLAPPARDHGVVLGGAERAEDGEDKIHGTVFDVLTIRAAKID
jgi:hypothetical protein